MTWIKAALKLSIQRAHLSCSENDQGLEDDDNPAWCGSLNIDKIRLTTRGTADCMRTVTCEGVDHTAVHLKRRQTRIPLNDGKEYTKSRAYLWSRYETMNSSVAYRTLNCQVTILLLTRTNPQK